ncbi:MAG: hypothetical protein ACLP9L_24190 [Thermoguttaceae bacterium]
MRRSRLVVCALGFAVLLGTVFSLAANPPEKSAGNKKPRSEKKAAQAAAPPVRRTGVEAVEAALAEPINCDFVETPLQDVIDYFRDSTHVEIYVDSPALKEAGVDLSTAVNCNLHGRFENVLRVVLNELQLDWAIHNDLLCITSPAKAESEEYMETRLYDVADLIVYQDENGKKFDDYAPLSDMIVSTIGTRTWQDNGGTGAILGKSLGTAKILVVANRYEIHKKIAALLAEIRKIAAKKSGGDELPHRYAPKAAQGMGGRSGLGLGVKPRPGLGPRGSGITPAAPEKSGSDNFPNLNPPTKK